MNNYAEVVVLVEGATEQRFVKQVLGPYMANRGVYTTPIILSKPGQKGGMSNSHVPETILKSISNSEETQGLRSLSITMVSGETGRDIRRQSFTPITKEKRRSCTMKLPKKCSICFPVEIQQHVSFLMFPCMRQKRCTSAIRLVWQICWEYPKTKLIRFSRSVESRKRSTIITRLHRLKDWRPFQIISKKPPPV